MEELYRRVSEQMTPELRARLRAVANTFDTVPAAEAGTRKDQVAIVTHVRFAATDRFEPGRVGKLGSHTLDELDETLRLVLDL